ncbi:MAG: CRISPR-associated protein Cas4 [Candidatus Cloacimonadaceae bacterium]|nr:CRISPR-associated protein Cas4 [Candidatus Cloacimonadaceae bacterium]MDP3115102.1 CRISPR-associated protein Cas4 [Candidatus Cloacimonadaceae bacterium]
MDFIFITPSEVIEHMFCPRFTYFMNVLKVGQHEHRRQLVNKGRLIHENKLVTNKDYLRKKVGADSKLLDVYLSSEQLMLVGKIDEVLFLQDGTAAPLDYKYAFWENRIYNTHIMQQTLYAMLIELQFQRTVNRAFIVYVRSKNHLEQIDITENLKIKAKKVLDDIFNIINLSYYPNAKKSKRKCEDCTYRNICVA